MKNIILASALLSACITNNALALNLFSIHKNAVKSATQSTNSNENNYTDFTGTWVGTCTSDENESGSSSITIRNDDVLIEINDQEFHLGNVKTESTSNKSHSEFSHTMINWNDDRTKLLFEDTSIRFEHSDYPFNKPKSAFTSIVKGIIGLANEQLTLKVEGIAFSSLSKIKEKIATNCIFDKSK